MYGVCILPILFVDTYHTRHFFSSIGNQESWEELCLVEWLKMNDHDRVEMNRGQMFNKPAARIEGPWFKQLPYSMTWLDRTYSPICPQVLKCSRISGLVCNMTNPELTSQLWIWWSSLKLTVFITWKWMVGILVSLIPFGVFRPIFRGELAVCFGECNMEYLHNSTDPDSLIQRWRVMRSESCLFYTQDSSICLFYVGPSFWSHSDIDL